jgi:hypothetical protein
MKMIRLPREGEEYAYFSPPSNAYASKRVLSPSRNCTKLRIRTLAAADPPRGPTCAIPPRLPDAGASLGCGLRGFFASAAAAIRRELSLSGREGATCRSPDRVRRKARGPRDATVTEAFVARETTHWQLDCHFAARARFLLIGLGPNLPLAALSALVCLGCGNRRVSLILDPLGVLKVIVLS